MISHGFHLCFDHMNSFLKGLPFRDRLQTTLPNGLDLKLFKEKILHIVKVEQLTQPIHHQAIQTLPLNNNFSLRPAPHFSQIGDEMEEGLTRIFKKCFEIFSVNDDANIRSMIQDLKTLHVSFDTSLSP